MRAKTFRYPNHKLNMNGGGGGGGVGFWGGVALGFCFGLILVLYA